MSSTPNHIILTDGRRLGFAEFGDLQGRPVFYFHGFPGSRLEAKLAEKISLDTHVRFIGIDRPGYGLSSFKPERTFYPDEGHFSIILNRIHEIWRIF
jgi:pimeloyl-ACP methyl ester carboxylesterase